MLGSRSVRPLSKSGLGKRDQRSQSFDSLEGKRIKICWDFSQGCVVIGQGGMAVN